MRKLLICIFSIVLLISAPASSFALTETYPVTIDNDMPSGIEEVINLDIEDIISDYDQSVNEAASKEGVKDEIGTYYEVSEEEYLEQSEKIVNKHVQEIILSDLEAQGVRNASDGIQLRAAGTYRTVYYDQYAKKKLVDKFAKMKAGDPLNGICGNGGELYYYYGGGNSYSFSVSFTSPWGVGVALNGSTGKRVNETGSTVSCPLPNKPNNTYKIKARKGYQCRPYKVQKKSGSKWVTISIGVVPVYTDVYARCVRTGSV